MNLDKNDLVTSIVAGMIGTVAFGAFFLAIGNKPVITKAIPALYGIQGPSLLAGGIIHLIHGAILGIIFAALVSAAGYKDLLSDIKSSLGLGAGYGVLTTALPSLLMPVWLSAVGFGGAPPFPNFNPMGLVGHIIYGVVLAAGYTLIRDQLE